MKKIAKKILFIILATLALSACSKSPSDNNETCRILFLGGEGTAARFVNSELREYYDQLKNDIAEAYKKWEAEAEKIGFRSALYPSFDAYGHVCINNQNLFSERVRFYSFWGGAHGTLEYRGYNFLFRCADGELATPKLLSISDAIKEGKLKEFLLRVAKKLPFETPESYAADIAKINGKSDFYEFYNRNIDGFVIRADGLEVFIQNYGFGGGNGGYGVLLKTEKIADILDAHILEIIKDAANKGTEGNDAAESGF